MVLTRTGFVLFDATLYVLFPDQYRGAVVLNS
jgi:hypothetical protein